MRKGVTPFIGLLALIMSIPSLFSVEQRYRVGVDTTWYPMQLVDNRSYLNGFIEDLLLQITKERKVTIEEIIVNNNNLLEKLQTDYESALTIKIPKKSLYSQYIFSSPILSLTPVLVLSKKVQMKAFEKDDTLPIAIVEMKYIPRAKQRFSSHPLRKYHSEKEALESILEGKCAAAILDVIPSWIYVQNEYKENLIIERVFPEREGIRFVAKQKDPIAFFERVIKNLEKKNQLKKLKEKWNLPPF